MPRRIGWLLVPLCWALACGGRFVQTPGGDDDDDTSTGQGGSASSKAGTTSRSGSTSSLGGKAVGGSLGTSGSVSVAGTAAIGGAPCGCDPIACPPGYQTVRDATGCCYHCELNLKACEVQRQGYLAFRQQLVNKYSYGCMVGADCSVYYDKNYCGATSCGISVPSSAYMNLASNLNSYAQMACSPGCPPAPEPPCDPSPPTCDNGYCQ